MRRITRSSARYVCPSCIASSAWRIVASQNAVPQPLLADGLLRHSAEFSSSSLCADNITSQSAASNHRPAPSDGQPSGRGRHVSQPLRTVPKIRMVLLSGYATDAKVKAGSLELDEEQMQQLQAAHRLRKRLMHGVHNAPNLQKLHATDALDGTPLEKVLEQVPIKDSPPDEARVLEALQQSYAGRTYLDFTEEIAKAASHRNPAQRMVTDDATKQILDRLGLLKPKPAGTEEARPTTTNPEASSWSSQRPSAKAGRQRRTTLLEAIAKHSEKAQTSTRRASSKVGKSASIPPFPTKPKPVTVLADDLHLNSVDIGTQPRVPELSFDLSRALFNPGVYHLRDPRSRVYNFDPYLEQPMPISEFNFDGLNAYVTSSEDQDLLGLARSLDKRYIGSSSSMSAALCQFHFLLSQWRELNTDHVTRGFNDVRRDFTVIMRSPAAVFLRYRDGVYAVDADKEYDTPNVLMSLGKSLEKLLTLEKSEFEKWRRTHTSADESFTDPQNEAFHYSEQGSFLLRSQLDAYDPRLPGTGVFDLKTRAVAGIRMNMIDHEHGMGYEIKDRFGTWESYEREYYDMMRSTMLKYSMQVRMGKMDGIFVAYHNIGRIFGFQYVPLSEMDHAIHGQAEQCLGDQEFKLSINFLKIIFDRVTEMFPQQSVRFHFDTKEITQTEPKPYMHIFAEPMTNEEIDEVQKRHHEEFEAFEKKVFSGQDPDSACREDSTVPVPGEKQATLDDFMAHRTIDTVLKMQADEAAAAQAGSPSGASSSTAADTSFLDKVMGRIPADAEPKELRPVAAFKLSIQNLVNGYPVQRPERLSPGSKWSVSYTLEQLGDESARKQYVFCKNRRLAALSAAKRQNSGYIMGIRDMSEQGAEWRRQQDELDAQSETVVLYQDRIQA